MTFIAKSVISDDTVFMARLEQTPGNEWRVTVFIARPGGSPPVGASDVTLQLLDDNGHGFPLLSSPNGNWVEAGGAAGTTASAEFQFGPTQNAPASLEVSRNGRIAKLQIRPKP